MKGGILNRMRTVAATWIHGTFIHGTLIHGSLIHGTTHPSIP